MCSWDLPDISALTLGLMHTFSGKPLLPMLATYIYVALSIQITHEHQLCNKCNMITTTLNTEIQYTGKEI